MDSKELRNLHEAYMDVYAPQENIEEGLRSAVKRLLGGGKKEAAAPKPESRGEQLRKKYNVGPEKSDTSAKRQILDRSRAKAEKDEKDYGDKPFQKQVANQSKSAHDKYLKAGYSKYGADLPVSGGQGGSGGSGRGSKAAKRAAALNREEFEIIVNALIEEGYDLSSYTWDEMYEVCLDEAVKGSSRHDTEMRKASAAERKSGIKNRLSPAAGKDNANKMQRDIKFFDKLTKKNRNVVGLVAKEEVDIFDTILEYLVAEGYADTNESALVIMANMSEEWREDIMEISQKTATRAFAKRATNEFESDSDNPRDFTKSGKSKADETKRRVDRKFGKKAGEHADRAAHAGIFGRKSFSMPKKPN